MQPEQQKSRASRNQMAGFSLVEVVLAIGVFATAIIAIIGLLPIVMTSDKGAITDTALAQMTTTATTILRNQGFAAVSTNSAYGDTTPDMYFNIDGNISLNSNGVPNTSPQKDSLYSCTVICISPSVTTGTSASTVATKNMVYLQIQFQWPVMAPSGHQSLRIVNTSLANYD